jgi:hypothetical protein
MSWLLEIKDAHTVGFGIEEDGVPNISGDANSVIFGGEQNPPLLAGIIESRASWSITVPEASDVALDGNNYGLLTRVRDDPTMIHGIALFYKANQDQHTDSVGFTIVVPQARFEQIRHLFELSLQSRAPMQSTIDFPFYGFREAAATTSTPTLQEFIDGKALVFDKVSFSSQKPRAPE